MMEELAIFYPNGHEAHYARGHPERPERMDAVLEGLKSAGLWERALHLDPLPVSQELLLGVHTLSYISLLETACARGSYLDGDTYTTPASWQLALNAAFGTAACVEAVWKREARRAFSLARPPGHHSGPGYGMGFCLINNIAVGAERALRLGAEKVAIVDLDLHHGNGTQDIFYTRPEVLYISTHQQHLYPGSGAVNDRGKGEGFGATANIPLPAFSGDVAFQAAMDRVILPLLERYEPQMVLVSLGFDTHWRDQLGYFQLSTGKLAGLIANLVEYVDRACDGKMVVVLEGGYDLDAMRTGSVAVVHALLGEPWTDPLGSSPVRENEEWKAAVDRAEAVLVKPAAG